MRTRRLIPWSQSEVKDHVEWLVQDTGNLRWSEPDIYKAINVALRGWSQRVKIPKLHNLADGFTAGVNEYTIPDYIGQNFYPRIKSSIITLLQVQQDDSTFNWLDLIGYSVDPQTDGTRKLRLHHPIYSEDAVILWFGVNGPVFTTIPTTSGSTSSTATSVVLGSAINNIGESGYLKIGSEYMSYAGITRGSATTTLNNLVRGLFGTTAATHNTGSNVEMVVVADDDRLWEQLSDATIAQLHGILLHRATPDDRQSHAEMMNYHNTRAEQFWAKKGYTTYPPKLLLSQRALQTID